MEIEILGWGEILVIGHRRDAADEVRRDQSGPMLLIGVDPMLSTSPCLFRIHLRLRSYCCADQCDRCAGQLSPATSSWPFNMVRAQACERVRRITDSGNETLRNGA